VASPGETRPQSQEVLIIGPRESPSAPARGRPRNLSRQIRHRREWSTASGHEAAPQRYFREFVQAPCLSLRRKPSGVSRLARMRDLNNPLALGSPCFQGARLADIEQSSCALAAWRQGMSGPVEAAATDAQGHCALGLDDGAGRTVLAMGSALPYDGPGPALGHAGPDRTSRASGTACNAQRRDAPSVRAFGRAQPAVGCVRPTSSRPWVRRRWRP